MKQTKLILTYQLSKEITKKLEELGVQFQIRLKNVPKAFYLEPLGFLAGIPGKKKLGIRYDGEELSEEMLVFSGFNGEELDLFLTEYRKSGLPKIELKAVITEYNITWDSLSLAKELKKERQELSEKKNDKS